MPKYVITVWLNNSDIKTSKEIEIDDSLIHLSIADYDEILEGKIKEAVSELIKYECTPLGEF